MRCGAMVTHIENPPAIVVPVRRRLWRVALTVLALHAPMLLWQSWCLTGLGGWRTQGIELALALPVGAGVTLIVVAVVSAFAHAHERAARCSLTGVALLLALVPAAWLGNAARMLAFRRAGERCAPLVAAIEGYVAATGVPPAALSDLRPRWIDRLPQRVPDLRLEVGDHLFGNPWILTASTPSGLINFDQFCYFPNQNYPERAWGGWWQRLGRWAYLHQ